MHLGLLRVLELFELKNSSSFIFELELLEIKKNISMLILRTFTSMLHTVI